MITFKQKGDFKKATRYFERLKEICKLGTLDKYGRAGVEALSSATPIDSGITSDSWSYEIEHGKGFAAIHFLNSNVNDGVNIAVILQYGHGTRNGGWVNGIDYINPAVKPLFEKMVDELWKEVTRI